LSIQLSPAVRTSFFIRILHLKLGFSNIKYIITTLRKKLFIVIAIILIGFVIAGLVILVKQKKIAESPEILSPQKVGEKVISYINENILKGQAVAVLVGEVKKENELYKLTIKVNNQEFPFYASRDGKLLFTNFIELDEKLTQEIPKTEKPDVELFVMSFCSYGNQAEEIMKPVINLLGDKFDLNINYIVSKDANGKFVSLHGEQELNQDIREICVLKYQKDKFWDFIEKINKSCTSQNADTCWEQIGKDLGIDTQKIKDCQNSEGNSLLEQELNLVQEYGVSGSPQLFINGVEYQGERTSEGYKNGICSGFETLPSECQQELSAETGSVEGGCK